MIFGLGIHHVGELAAEILARYRGSMDALMNAATEELEEIPEIGPKMALTISSFFGEPHNIELIRRLRDHGVTMVQHESNEESRPQVFHGKTVVFTGTVFQMTRSDAKQAIEERGGRVTSSVSQKTDFVVAGEDPGPKVEKATKLGVAILDEAAFLRML